MQRKWSHSQVRASRSTTIAWVGQRSMQTRQTRQFSGSKARCPRVRSKRFAGSAGYREVGGREKRFPVIVFAMVKTPMRSPLRAPDARVDREDDDRHVRELEPLHGREQRR